MTFTHFFGGQFFAGDFFGGAGVVVIDTHDGFDSEKKRDEEKANARARLREQLTAALDGPQAPEIRNALTPYSRKSESLPFLETLDWDRVEKRLDKIKALEGILRDMEASGPLQARLRAIEQAIEDDDEDIFLLI